MNYIIEEDIINFEDNETTIPKDGMMDGVGNVAPV